MSSEQLYEEMQAMITSQNPVIKASPNSVLNTIDLVSYIKVFKTLKVYFFGNENISHNQSFSKHERK